MTSIRTLPRLLPVAVVLTLAACAGESGASAEGETTVAVDSTVKPITREPLTEADLMGLAMADVSVELPWTRNRVVRDPAPNQGPGWLESTEASDGSGFSRVALTFSDIAFFPGYEIDLVDAGTAVSCAGQEKTLSLSGERALVIRLRPANAHDAKGVRVPVRTGSLGTEGFTDGGVVCDADDNVVWAAGLGAADQVRVLELRKPNRLVVDVR